MWIAQFHNCDKAQSSSTNLLMTPREWDKNEKKLF